MTCARVVLKGKYSFNFPANFNVGCFASDLILPQNCMHAVFELVEHEMIFRFVFFGTKILGNRAEEMKLNFNLFLWPAPWIFKVKHVLWPIFVLIYCQNCRMAKQRKTNQMTLPNRLITYFGDDKFCLFDLWLIMISTDFKSPIKLIKNRSNEIKLWKSLWLQFNSFLALIGFDSNWFCYQRFWYQKIHWTLNCRRKIPELI